MSKANQVNTRNVAKRAGVSHVTVSRVLNNHPYVSEKTRLKVNLALKELNYNSNPLVKAYTAQIRSNRNLKVSCTIGWICGLDDEHKIFPWLLPYKDAFFKAANALGYQVDDLSLQFLEHSKKSFERIIRARGIRGLLVADINIPSSLKINLEELACAALGVGMNTSPLRVNRVCQDYGNDVTLVFNELMARGYKRIGLFHGVYDMSLSEGATYSSYLLNAHRLSQENRIPPLIYEKYDEEKSAVQKLLIDWLERHKPDVILVGRNDIADFLKSQGYEIPEKLGLVHLSMGEAIDSDLSGIQHNTEQHATHALQLINDQIMRNDYGLRNWPIVKLIRGSWRNGKTVKNTTEAYQRLPISDPFKVRHYDWYETQIYNNITG